MILILDRLRNLKDGDWIVVNSAWTFQRIGDEYSLSLRGPGRDVHVTTGTAEECMQRAGVRLED